MSLVFVFVFLNYMLIILKCRHLLNNQMTEEHMHSVPADKCSGTGGQCSGARAVLLGAAGRGDGNADPSMLAVFQDYVKLMPLVAEANQMGEELDKVRARGRSSIQSRKGPREQGPRPLIPPPRPAPWCGWGHGGLERSGPGTPP